MFLFLNFFPKTEFFYIAILCHRFRDLNILRNAVLLWDCSLVCSSDNFTLKELLFSAWWLSYPRKDSSRDCVECKIKNCSDLKVIPTSRGILFHQINLTEIENPKDLGSTSLKFLFTKKAVHFFPRKFSLCLSKSTNGATVYCSNLNWVYFAAIHWTTATCTRSTLRRTAGPHTPQNWVRGTTTTIGITTTTPTTGPSLPKARTSFLQFQTQPVSPLQCVISVTVLLSGFPPWRMCFLFVFTSFVACANETRFAISLVCYGAVGFGVRWVFHSWTNTPLVTDTDSLTTWHRLLFHCYYLFV